MPVELVWRVLQDAPAVVVEVVRGVELAVVVLAALGRTSAAEAGQDREGLQGQADILVTMGPLARVAGVAVLERLVRCNIGYAIPMAMKKNRL